MSTKTEGRSTVSCGICRLAGATTFALAMTQTGYAAGDQGLVSIAFTQTDDKSEAQGNKGRDLVTIVNAHAGYAMASGLTLGLKYFNYNQNGRTTDSSGVVISGYGPLVGYMHASGVFANASYLLFPTKEYEDSRAKTTYSDGKGYVIDIGKLFLFGAWGAGAQLSYSKVDYDKVKVGNGTETDLTGSWNDTSLYPYLTVIVFF